MRNKKIFTSLVLVCSAYCVSAQTPAGQSGVTDPLKQDPNSQPTPQQIREKQIRVFDPLDKSNPLIQDDKNQNGDQDVNGASPAQSTRPARRSAATPLPGSLAASSQAAQRNREKDGPDVSSDEESPTQEYTGPAVLSRSYTISRPMTPEQVKWAPHLAFMTSYDDSPQIGGTGTGSGVGFIGSWGITGRHVGRRDQFGLDYNGSESKIGGYSNGLNSNHTLSADYQHVFSRRLSVNVVTTGSIYSQNYGFLDLGLAQGASPANIDIAASPSIQLLDTGTRQLSNQVGLTWRQNSRLSFSASGGVFFAERTGGLFGNTGYQAQGDVNYRKTRRMTVGSYYSFTDYMFSHRVSVANVNTFGGIFSYALGRSMQFRFRGGVSRLETQGLQQVAIDPAIAALLGQSSTIIEFYHRNLTSDISAQLVKDFRHNRTASIAYVKGVSPGNGLLLTSTQEGITGNFGMRLFRKYTVNVSGDRTSLSSAGQLISSYKSKNFSLSVSRPVNHHVSADFGVAYRMFNSFDVMGYQLPSHQLRITSGISWNPGDNWLKSW